MEFKLLGGFAITLVVVLLAMPHFIKYLKKISFQQTASEYSLEEYKKKNDTPIMGGVLFILVPIIVTLCLMPESLQEKDCVIVMLSLLLYGAIGFLDDYLIAVKKDNNGLTPKFKMLLQLIVAVVMFYLYRGNLSLNLYLPFSQRNWYLGNGYLILAMLMYAGSSNAVNLTDGMDGLASGCTILALIPFLIIAFMNQRSGIVVFIGCLIAGLFGYLHYNKKPARIFMGDTGSLALGGTLAALAMVMSKEIALIFIGGIFVVETLCVMIQIGSVKIRHKKVFPYTPIHYAFVIKGMGEKQVVHMFWLVELAFAVIGFFVGLR